MSDVVNARDGAAAGGAAARDESRTRRVRALLCTAPLHDLHVNRSARGGIFERLDCYDLALGAIDFVVDRMGFDTGADPDELLDHLCAGVAEWAPDATEEGVTAAARVVNETRRDLHRAGLESSGPEGQGQARGPGQARPIRTESTGGR